MSKYLTLFTKFEYQVSFFNTQESKMNIISYGMRWIVRKTTKAYIEYHDTHEHLFSIPYEIFYMIMMKLPLRDLIKLASTCHYYRELVFGTMRKQLSIDTIIDNLSADIYEKLITIFNDNEFNAVFRLYKSSRILSSSNFIPISHHGVTYRVYSNCIHIIMKHTMVIYYDNAKYFTECRRDNICHNVVFGFYHWQRLGFIHWIHKHNDNRWLCDNDPGLKFANEVKYIEHNGIIFPYFDSNQFKLELRLGNLSYPRLGDVYSYPTIKKYYT